MAMYLSRNIFFQNHLGGRYTLKFHTRSTLNNFQTLLNMGGAGFSNLNPA